MIHHSPEELKSLREALEEADRELLFLLQKRDQITERIARAKKEHDIPVLQLAYRDSALSRLMNEGEALSLNPDLIRNVFDLLHEYSVDKQNRMRNEA